jgi:hypothetical protein
MGQPVEDRHRADERARLLLGPRCVPHVRSSRR